MHETSLVAELVAECERRAQGRPITRVRVRHASSIEDDALRAIFAALTTDGPLTNTALETEEFEASMTCGECGYTGLLDHDHVYGHVRVCPSCEAISDDAMSPELELIGVDIADVNSASTSAS